MNDTQKACPHVFIGRANGVHCTRCGLHLTARQYHELLHPPESAQDTENAEPDKEPTGDRKSAESTAEAPQTKLKRTRKKKEATANE